MQLVVFQRFAEQEGQIQVAEKMASTLAFINSILEVRDTPDQEDVFKNSEDFVSQAISEAVNDFENL